MKPESAKRMGLTDVRFIHAGGTAGDIGDEILIRIDDDVFSAGFTEMRLLPLSSTRRLSHSMADSFIRRKLRSKIPSQPALPDREPV